MPIYMKIEGVEGPVTGKYKGWIELQSAQLGSARHITSPTGQGNNREADAPTVSEIVVTKFQDSVSQLLFNLSLTGNGKKVTIDFVKGNDAPYLEIELEDMLISGYSISGHGGDSQNRPMESLSLNFTKISFKTLSSTTDPAANKQKVVWQTAP